MTTDNEPRVVEADIAKERADWLLDAVATATQDRRFLRGDPEYDDVAGEAILLNGEKAILVALSRIATEEACRAREAEALRHLDAVLDMADEAYRKYCGEEFDGFDAEDVAVLQAARNYWLEAAFPRAKATTDATGEGK